MKYGSNYWEQFGPKIGRNVRLFSDLEHDHWILVETNSDIVDFCEQPLETSVLVDGSHVKSVPDMWVRYKNGNECVRQSKSAEFCCDNFYQYAAISSFYAWV
ncbi:hypothetical protein BAG01nite_34420 [Brevibacillus agri]|uniref:Uncharacterized protein n=1 Tax=Brevibacillus agri TaxID=51101 RepID=A0ABQ0SVE9_9BACL|nr:hypothetical protein BAG01nite_34420 [Brevibacillus agri]